MDQDAKFGESITFKNLLHKHLMLFNFLLQSEYCINRDLNHWFKALHCFLLKMWFLQ